MRPLLCKWRALACVISMASGLNHVEAASSVLIWPLDPVIEADQKAVALWLENKGRETAYMQIRVVGWEQREFDNHYQTQREVIGSPPLARIEPGQKQLIRLTRTETVPVGVERAYRIIIDDIPVVAPKDGSHEVMAAGVNLQMRYTVPLFVYGEGLRGKPVTKRQRDAASAGAPDLSWRKVTVQGTPWLQVQNLGQVHARLTQVSMAQGGKRWPVAPGLLGYVLPGAIMRWPLPPGTSTAGQLLARVNNEPAAQPVASAP